MGGGSGGGGLRVNGWCVGGGDVACGMKRMSQVMITKKKDKKHLHFHLEAMGGVVFYVRIPPPFLCLLYPS